jgi:hypothetical protein
MTVGVPDPTGIGEPEGVVDGIAVFLGVGDAKIAVK